MKRIILLLAILTTYLGSIAQTTNNTPTVFTNGLGSNTYFNLPTQATAPTSSQVRAGSMYHNSITGLYMRYNGSIWESVAMTKQIGDSLLNVYKKTQVDGLLALKVDKTTTVAGFPLSNNVALANHSVGYGIIGSLYNGSNATSWTLDTASANGAVSKLRLTDYTYSKSVSDGRFSTKLETTNALQLKQSNPPVLYNKSYWTSISDFTNVGNTLTATTSGRLALSGGTSDFSKYFQISSIQNTDENKEYSITFQINSTIATSFGIGIGAKSVNTWYAANSFVRFDPTTNTITIYSSTNVALASTSTGHSVAINDVLKLTFTQIGNIIGASLENITQASKSAVSVTGNLGTTKNLLLPNSAKPTIYNFSGSFDILGINILSNSNISPDVAFIGDSKTQGYSSTSIGQRFASLNDKIGTVGVFGADGDRTVELVNSVDFISQVIHPKIAILCIGRNDLASSVPDATWQSNYRLIVTKLQSTGTVIVHLLPIPETVQDQTVLRNWIIAEYGLGNCIDPAIGWDNTKYLSTDGVHQNIDGHRFNALTIKNSGKLPEKDYGNKVATVSAQSRTPTLQEVATAGNTTNTSVQVSQLNVGGPAINAGFNISVVKNITGVSGFGTGIGVNGIVQSSVTNGANYFQSFSNTATGFSLSFLNHYSAQQGTFLGTVANQTGFFASSSIIGAVNNRAFWGEIPSGTSRWNLYMDGTAQNWINGFTGFGTLKSIPTARIDIAAGTTTILPLRLEAGPLLTTPLSGGVEFLTDKFYATISTGASRKEFTLNDAPLTVNTVPYVTTNGRLTSSTILVSELGYLSGVSSNIQTQLNTKGSGTVTSFGKVDGFGIVSSVANSTTTPVHTVAVDTTSAGLRTVLNSYSKAQSDALFTASSGITKTGKNFTLGGTGSPITGSSNVGISSGGMLSFGDITNTNIYYTGDISMRSGNIGTPGQVSIGLKRNSTLESSIIFTPSSITLYDNINGRGIEYQSDFSANYTARSLVDKNYVDLKTGSYPYLAKTGNYTVLASDWGTSAILTITVNASAGAVVITLPTSSTVAGKILNIKKMDSSGNTVTLSSGTNIDGSTSLVVSMQYGNAQIQSISTQYITL